MLKQIKGRLFEPIHELTEGFALSAWNVRFGGMVGSSANFRNVSCKGC